MKPKLCGAWGAVVVVVVALAAPEVGAVVATLITSGTRTAARNPRLFPVLPFVAGNATRKGIRRLTAPGGSLAGPSGGRGRGRGGRHSAVAPKWGEQ